MFASIDNLSYLAEELKTFRQDLHKNPELGFKEIRTSKKIYNELKDMGLDVYSNIGKTGIVGVLKKGNGNKRIMLRADMDALPIQETSNHDYISQNPGVMHACGHDGHTTMLLGAAKYLSKKNTFSGTVYFVFQPNEEHGLGAKAMLDDGLLKLCPTQEIYGMHYLPGSPLGEISSREGVICASETLFEINILAKGGHSSMPHLGVDSILVGSDLVMSIQTIVSRKLKPGTGSVISVTEFNSDGSRMAVLIREGIHLISFSDTNFSSPSITRVLWTNTNTYGVPSSFANASFLMTHFDNLHDNAYKSELNLTDDAKALSVDADNNYIITFSDNNFSDPTLAFQFEDDCSSCIANNITYTSFEISYSF